MCNLVSYHSFNLNDLKSGKICFGGDSLKISYVYFRLIIKKVANELKFASLSFHFSVYIIINFHFSKFHGFLSDMQFL